MRHWGGAKAGTRQAEGVFAFLLDRGERGAAKDEFIELIWPAVTWCAPLSPSIARSAVCAGALDPGGGRRSWRRHHASTTTDTDSTPD